MIKVERRAWCLKGRIAGKHRLLGPYCWPESDPSDFYVRLFKTRREAREAKKTCCYKNAVVCSVIVTVEERE